MTCCHPTHGSRLHNRYESEVVRAILDISGSDSSLYDKVNNWVLIGAGLRPNIVLEQDVPVARSYMRVNDYLFRPQLVGVRNECDLSSLKFYSG